MLILLIPVIIPLLLIAGIFFIIIRRYCLGAILIIGAIIANIYTQTYPLHPTYFTANKEKTQDLRILIYNIGLNNKYLNENKDNLHEIEKFFSSQDADIVVLPESRLSRRQALRTMLDSMYQYDITQNYAIDPRYIETYVFSRYPILNIESIGHYIYAMQIILPADTLSLISCHLTSNQSHSKLNAEDGFWVNLQKGFDSRKAQADTIVNYISAEQGMTASLRHPIVICGDFNDLSGSETIRKIQGLNNLEDAWWQGGFGYGATFTGKHLYFRLDHILYSPQYLELQHVDIPSVSFSDHLPLVADFKLN